MPISSAAEALADACGLLVFDDPGAGAQDVGPEPRIAQGCIRVIASLAGALGAFLIKRGEEIDAAAKPTSR